jgi:mono/diheme cytochrome c family protein
MHASLNRKKWLLLVLNIACASALSSRGAFAQSSGEDTFKAKCLMCHGADGLGNTPMGKALAVPPYNTPDVRKLKDADLTAIIKNGKGGKMPAFGTQLTDAQIKDLLAHIHTLQK